MQKGNLLSIERNFEISNLIGHNITFVNPFSYLEVIKPSSAFTITEFKIFADGIAVVVLYNLFLGANIRRFSFDSTSVASVVFDFAQKTNLKVFLVGGKPNTINKAAEHLLGNFPKINFTVASGYFSDSNSRPEVLRRAGEADIVIVGMGAPLQEIFLSDLRKTGWRGTGFTCGGFFEQTAKKGTFYYPKWVDRLHLRWLYRLFDEPKRLAGRYLVYYPIFLVTFFVRLFSASK